MTAPARLELPDALRALALGGVLLVNTMGYRVMPGGPVLGEVEPAGSLVASAVQALVAAVVQGKAYPALAFLFGLSLALSVQDRRAPSLQRARRRLHALLALGVLHGLFLYAGDVLTAYALCGWLALAQVRAPHERLRTRMRRAAWLVAIPFAVLALLLALTLVLDSGPAGGWGRVDPRRAGLGETFGSVAHLGAYVALNASAYLAANAAAAIFMYPLVYLLMLAGIAAARLRLLTHRRWRAWRQAQVRRWLGWLVAGNVAYGVAVAGLGSAGSGWLLLLDLVAPLVCVPLSAVLVLALATRWEQGARAWATRLAPLGRCTLSVYLGHSVVCMGLLSGAGLGWQAGTAALAGLAALVWLAALLLAQRSTRRWPLEAWLGRRA